MRPESWIFFLQRGLTESMASGAEKDREILPLTWRNYWKLALKIRGFGPENEGENEATVLDFFSADRPHGIHGFLRQEGPRNHPLDLEKLLEIGSQNSGVLAGE